MSLSDDKIATEEAMAVVAALNCVDPDHQHTKALCNALLEHLREYHFVVGLHALGERLAAGLTGIPPEHRVATTDFILGAIRFAVTESLQ